MTYQNLRVEEASYTITITFNREEQRNSITHSLLQELNHVLDQIEVNPNCKIVLLKAEGEIFCSGFDLKELAIMFLDNATTELQGQTTLYMATLKRLTTFPKVVVTLINGKVMAGGLGFVAASDIAIATRKAFFSLPEGLWGLLPAMVSVYLIRRIGFQKTYALALTTQTLDAEEAERIHLVDAVVVEPTEYLAKLQEKLNRLDLESIQKMKRYFQSAYPINEKLEQKALEESTELFLDAKVQVNIRNYVEKGQYPWK